MDDHWRNSQKITRFFIFDARVFFILLFCLMHIRLWTLTLSAMAILIFWGMERRGLTFEASLRALRAWIFGEYRPATSRRFRRRWIDFGG